MTDHTAPATEAEAATPWTDPVCTEFAVADLTQAGAFGNTDGGIFS
jgi:hypothetical protein